MFKLLIRLPRWPSGCKCDCRQGVSGSIPGSGEVLLGLFSVFRKFVIGSTESGNVPGPYGGKTKQIFIQKVVPDTDTVCTIRSVDGSAVSCFVVAECEGALRPRRLLLCGHRSGATQMWDLTAPIDRAVKLQPVPGNGATDGEESQAPDGGPTPDELVRLLSACDLDATPVPVVRVHRPALYAPHATDFSLSCIETHTTEYTDPHRTDRINAYMRCVLMTSYGMRAVRTMRACERLPLFTTVNIVEQNKTLHHTNIDF
ncbi:hypothetical protein SFRURICE_017342 [Spodoptera frugiperda]|nr:hypothetical protein SFRURICE_017342 [Spodoptera frugiperda]